MVSSYGIPQVLINAVSSVTDSQNVGARPGEKGFKGREHRFESHALIEVQLQWWNPFSKHSAVLLDLSASGCKIEFVNPIKLTTQKKVQLHIPLTPFGIDSITVLHAQAEVKWFDVTCLRCGCVFIQLDETKKYAIEQALNRIEKVVKA
jgi:hypothetical protein